jgi:hypothetical protein
MRLGWTYGSFGMVLRTLSTRVFGISDRTRWRDLANHDIAWDKRTRAIAALVPDGAHVIEFGAGRCRLRDWLPPNCTYLPSDIVDRGSGSWLCDLNRRPLPPLERRAVTQVAVFSGVLEYVVDVRGVLRWLAPHVDRIAVSYNVAPEAGGSASRLQTAAARLSAGWVNSFTDAELRAIFRDASYRCAIDCAVEGERDERIYVFARSSAP